MRNRRYSLWLVAVVMLLALPGPRATAAQETYDDDELPAGVEEATVENQPINASATPEVDTATPLFAGRLSSVVPEVELAISTNGDVVRFTVEVDQATAVFEGRAPDPLAPGTYSFYIDDELVGDFIVSYELRLDLPAMTLVPADLEEDDAGFVTGQFVFLDEQAERVAESLGQSDPETIADIRADLNAAGWQRRYESALAVPGDSDTTPISLSIGSFIIEYADPDSAAAAFERVAAQGDDTVSGTVTVGDQSTILAEEGATEGTGTAFSSLTLTFQLGQLLAGATITDFEGTEPEVARVESLAQTLQGRIEDVIPRSAQPLSGELLRLDLDERVVPSTDEEAYRLLDGEPIPLFAESDTERAERVDRFGNATTVYAAAITGALQSEEADAEAAVADFSYRVVLYRFAAEDEAIDWMADLPERLERDQLPGYLRFAAVSDASTIGDESATYLFDYATAEVRASGYRIYARVGDEVVEIELGVAPDAALETVEEVADAQVACLEAGACDELAPVSESLLEGASS